MVKLKCYFILVILLFLMIGCAFQEISQPIYKPHPFLEIHYNWYHFGEDLIIDFSAKNGGDADIEWGILCWGYELNTNEIKYITIRIDELKINGYMDGSVTEDVGKSVISSVWFENGYFNPS